jgi:hypothetical protein
MRKELRRSLFAAAIAGVALAGCGGGGGGGSPAPSPAPSPSPSPTPPPPPPPPSAGSYFLVGIAGGAASAGTPIPFADLEPPADPSGAGQAPGLYGIQFVDPANQPVPFQVTQGQVQLAPGGTALPLATVSEYFPNGSSATAWGTRYLVYASATSNSNGLLYAVDLRKSGTTPANPAPVQLSSATVAGAQLCSTAPVVFDNYAAANLSRIQFRVLGNDHNCGTLDDKFAIFQLSMNSATAPVSLGSISQVELVQPIYNTGGTITGFLAINHPATDPTTGFPTVPVPLQQYDANLANPKNFATPLAGTGHDVTSGDFLNLGITSGNVWLYWDYNGVYGLNVATGAISLIQALTNNDRVDNGAVFDGTNVYVPIDNGSALGAWILQINESTLAPTAGPRDTTLSSIRLVGETTGALVYFGSTVATPIVTNLLSAPKSTLTRNAGTLNGTLSPNQSIDSLMGLNAPTAPVAFLVGDTVYFTIADSSASGSTGFAKQAFYVTMNGSGAPAAAAAPVATSVSAVLGAVAPASIPTSGTVTNVGALVISKGANALPAFAGTPGGADFEIGSGANPPTLVTSGSLDLYNSAGMAGANIGSLGTISPLTGNAVSLPASPVYWAALASGPVQAGMPAMLQLTGSAGSSPAEDIAVITPDTASTLSQDSDFAQ